MNSKCVLKNLGTGGRGTGVHTRPCVSKANLDEERKKIADLLKPVFADLYPASNAEYRIYDFMQTAMIKGFELLNKDNPEEAEKKKNQVREMSKKITRLEEFFEASGLKGLVDKF